MSSFTFLVIVLILVEMSGEIFGEEHYEKEKRFLFETTTSHFADSKLAAMEASVLELRSRVQKLEEENQLSNTLAYRLNHEFNTVQSQLNATMYHQQLMKTELNNEIDYRYKKIRLVDAFGNVNSVRGRVEIFHNNSWGTVCDDSFSSVEARVTCHMLGWKNPSPTSHGSAYYGQGQGSVLLDDLGCTGTEKALWNCSNPGWYQENCGHGEDVGVDCYHSSTHILPAFHAETTSSYPITSIQSNQALAFRHVLYNEGGHYSTNGQFTCTIPGTYVFYLGLKPHGTVPVKAYITKNGSDKLAVVDSVDGHGYTRFASNVAIMKLSQNQKVFVRVDQGQSSGARLDNEMNYFSGFLLYQNV